MSLPQPSSGVVGTSSSIFAVQDKPAVLSPVGDSFGMPPSYAYDGARSVVETQVALDDSLEEIGIVLRAGTLRDVMAIIHELAKIRTKSGSKVDNFAKVIDATFRAHKGGGEITHYVDEDGARLEMNDQRRDELKEKMIESVLGRVRDDPECFHQLVSDPVFPFRIRESLALLEKAQPWLREIRSVLREDLAEARSEWWFPPNATPRQMLLKLGAYFKRHDDRYEDFVSRARGTTMDLVGWLTLAMTARVWAGCGFPCVQPSHRLAAALMATWIPPECLDGVEAPWPYTLFTVPDGLGLSVGGRAISAVGLLSPIPELNDPETAHYVSLFPAGRSPEEIVVYLAPFRSLADMANGSKSVLYVTGGSKLNIQEADYPTIDLACRLILNCLIELNESSEHRARIDAGPPRAASARPNKVATGRGRGGGETEPSAWVFAVSRDVRHDLRDWVREYASGEGTGRSPRVQCMVRGHRRRQVCGRGRLERKTIWIQPFWRGGQDLPIAVREHVLDRVRKKERAERMQDEGTATSETSKEGEASHGERER